MRVRRALVALFALTIVGVGLAVGSGWWMWQRINVPYRAFAGDEAFVEVAPGLSTTAIGRRLVTAGVVPDELTFRTALWWSGAATGLKAGEYRFTDALTPLDVVKVMAAGHVFTRPLTFPEGLTLAEMATLFESRGAGTARAFLDAANDVSAIADIDPQARDLEGYLFPETYPLSRRSTARDIVGSMVDRFRMVWAEVTANASLGTMSPRQVVALASLVEKETAAPAERPLVSAVYRNRLRIGMGLQADPTVVYALMKAGRYDGNIRKADLAFDSRYNTYRYSGLPPGPIAAPGRAALEAALAPADVPYLFFVSRNDGSHAFAETLREHNANVQRFQVEFFRRARAERAAVSRTPPRRSRR